MNTSATEDAMGPSLTFPDRLDLLKHQLGERTRELREQHRWTQRHLAKQLGVSQGRISRIENGDASWNAEEFLVLLQLLNADLGDFIQTASADGALQNALARYGAAHLREDAAAGLSPALDTPRAVVRDVLLDPTSERFVTALAPVLVFAINRLSLPTLQNELDRAGVPNRLGWVAENTLHAISALPSDAPHRQRLETQRAVLLLETFLANVQPSERGLIDPFDQGVRAEQSLQRLWSEASDLSKKWRIASALSVDDFTHALREALEHHR